ncbi:MAG: BrnA antitoxin family protein [Anaerolineales bacterium]|nr:BrnA antitoxin family protein [Anaerolineales bacterium]
MKKGPAGWRPLIGSAPRKDIHIRLDREVLEKLKAKAKKKGVKYQSLINEILKKAV